MVPVKKLLYNPIVPKMRKREDMRGCNDPITCSKKAFSLTHLRQGAKFGRDGANESTIVDKEMSQVRQCRQTGGYSPIEIVWAEIEFLCCK